MSEPILKPLGKLGGINCFSKIYSQDSRVGRAIIDDNGDTLTKSTKLFDNEDLCIGDLTNTFTRLQKIGNDHVMGELEY